MERVHPEGVFEIELGETPPGSYRMGVSWDGGGESEMDDPYRFLPSLEPDQLAAFGRGEESRLYHLLGAHPETRQEVRGTRFRVWAPAARAVNLMGSFNGWEARTHPMYPVVGSGVWELFVPGVEGGTQYKYQIRPTAAVTRSIAEEETARVRRSAAGEGRTLRSKRTPAAKTEERRPLSLEKADPFGFDHEVRPRSASVVRDPDSHSWTDGGWLEQRASETVSHAPVSIYEVHLGSWRRREDGEWPGYRDLAEDLLPYVKELGFTHLELLPITEHPHDPSWGYQALGYFAPTSRYGSPKDFKAFVDAAHGLGLGVILDWVPAHFPLDAHGLSRFDGTHLYEHPDPMRGIHPDWGTAIFDYGKPEVVSFLISSARFWLEEYHLDGLRVDAVASMLYLDYSRADGEWLPNELGGRENLEAVAFLRRLTDTVHDAFPDALLFAEESTAWPRVSGPTGEGGLGFDLKWNMGWMNDTLSYFEADPFARHAAHGKLTFSIHYAHNEQYLLPLSHDEVVHLKHSLLSKMPGGYEEKFANLRALFAYMWAHPGKKLLFMGGELGEWSEWDENGELDWSLLNFPQHRGMRRFVGALNRLYTEEPALHALDFLPDGFEWIEVHDDARSVIAFLRWSLEWEDFVLVVANFSGTRWRDYRLGAPSPGEYVAILDSESPEFLGRSDPAGVLRFIARDEEWHGRSASLTLDLAPLSCLYLKRASDSDHSVP
jgi:1,4-alpha-glucan branching enzyme